MPQVLQSGVDVNVAGDAYIELEAMKMIMALVPRGSSIETPSSILAIHSCAKQSKFVDQRNHPGDEFVELLLPRR